MHFDLYIIFARQSVFFKFAFKQTILQEFFEKTASLAYFSHILRHVLLNRRDGIEYYL